MTPRSRVRVLTFLFFLRVSFSEVSSTSVHSLYINSTMQFLLICLLFLSVTLFTYADQKKVSTIGSSIRSLFNSSHTAKRLFWEKRSPAYEITECIFVTSEESRYFYEKTSDSEKVCGVYFFADPDEVIEIHFEYLDVPCDTGGLISFVDGWELKGQFFPGIEDHEKTLSERYKEMCGKENFKKVFVTSQNAGMLQYKLTEKGTGFGFRVNFAKTPTPCNILVENQEGIYTLRNHGKSINCSLLAVFPAKIDILALNIGVGNPQAALQWKTGTLHKCQRKRSKDFLQIGGSEGLDSSSFLPFEDLCGIDFFPELEEINIDCGTTIVRLTSSGKYDNSATFTIGQLEEEDFSTYTCQY